MQSRYIKRTLEGYLLVSPLLLGCGIFYALPFWQVLRNAVCSGVGSASHFVGAQNFAALIKNSMFRLAMRNTFRFLLTVLPLALAIGFAIALVLKQHSRKHTWVRSVLLLPYTMPVVGTVMLVDLFFGGSGLGGRLAAMLGLPIADWLDSGGSIAIVAALYLWKNTGYAVILLLSGLVTIPEEYYASAGLDGAGAWQQLWYITLPQMWYSFFFTAVFSLINAFKCFREIFLIGGTHPNPGIYMLQHFIYNAFEKLNDSKLSAASVLLLLILTAAFCACYRLVLKKERFRE